MTAQGKTSGTPSGLGPAMDRAIYARAVSDIDAAMALGFMAALFAVQPETWPVFLTFCEKTARESGAADPWGLRDRELALELTDILGRGACMMGEPEVFDFGATEADL